MRMLDIQGTPRTFIVDAPPVIDPNEPLALTFVFHGNGGTGQGIQGMGLQNVPDAIDHGVFVFPDGLQYMNFGVGWNGTCDEYDMELFDTIVAQLSDEYCIAEDRIFAAGFSWGGDMCNSLACCRGDVVRAIAPASGPEFYPFDCYDTDRPAVRMTWATNDAYPNELFDETVDFYRSEHACAPTSMPIDPTPCVAYDDCAEPVIACEYEGLGHAWPQDWAEQTWAFFSTFQ
jgi:poly(3-hydroxybutyrate) depolymerase